jgi:hypothetical protein
MYIYILRDGRPIGPYSLEQLQAFLREGRLSKSELCWMYGSSSWQPLGRILNSIANKEVLFHHVSPAKFILANVFSFNVYSIYWFYKNWKFVRERLGITITPWLRALLWPFFTTQFIPELQRFSEDVLNRRRLKIAAALAVVLWLVGLLPSSWSLLSLLSFVALLPFVVQIDQLNRERGITATYYRQLSAKAYLGGLLAVALQLLILAQAFQLLPDTAVIKGESLASWNRAYLVRHQLVDPNERVIYFYSAGAWSIGEDGNILTDKRVISYYYDEESGRRVVESAMFSEIDELEVGEDEGQHYTQVVVRTLDEANFTIILSPEEGMDAAFIAELRKRMSQDRHRQEL